jgi:hypothetical protein
MPSAKQVKIHWQAVRWLYKYNRTDADKAEGNAQEHLHAAVSSITHIAFESESSHV